MPVIFGTVLAVVYGQADFNWWIFLLALMGMILLHSGANILSDIHDFERGLDTVPNPTSGGVVRGLISIKEARRASILLFLSGGIIGLFLTWLSGAWLLVIGLAGLAIGFFYTTGSRGALKYNALGDLAVFLISVSWVRWVPGMYKQALYPGFLCCGPCQWLPWSLLFYMQITGAISNLIKKVIFLQLPHYWATKTQ